eukprot:s1948_g18.t1
MSQAVCGLEPLRHPSVPSNLTGARSQMHLPLGPGLKALQSLSQQLVAEDHFEAQAGEVSIRWLSETGYAPYVDVSNVGNTWKMTRHEISGYR